MLRPPVFRQSLLSDFTACAYNGLSESSYKQAAFPLGCSLSEFEMSLDDREITLLCQDLSISAFFRIKSAEATHLFFDLFCVAEANACIDALEAIMAHLLEEYAISKFFVQLFDHESAEQELLLACGFVEEARLVDQVWLQGRFQDVVIMGSPLHV